MVAAAYEFLRTTPPFKRWRLPDAEAIEFNVLRISHLQAQHQRYHRTRNHVITVSELRVGHTLTLLGAVAHEMIHLYQDERGTETKGAEHNAEFQRLAKLVCRYHGFDPKAF